MFGSFNKVILIGNVGKDSVSVPMSTKACKFSLATTESWKDRTTGERKSKTEWHSILVTSPNLAQICESYVRKGTKLCVEGTLKYSKWQDSSGNERYGVDVVVGQFNGSISILSSMKNDGGQGGAQNAGASESSGASGSGSQYGEYSDDVASSFDDEIPFQ